MSNFNMKVTPEIENLAALCCDNSKLDLSLYGKYDVKRGLRDLNGKGVLAGLTQISNVNAVKVVDGKEIPCAGSLSYRGYDIKDLTRDFITDGRHGFEETAYLLLFGKLPAKEELRDFCLLLENQRALPRNFVRDVIMKAPSKDIMNALSRSVLTLYCYDKNPEGLSTAENFLRMLRPDKKYTALEAKILDIALILHMEHGGGNNSTFTTHVVSSSGTDTYSTVAAALGSLKGPKHGGANIKVVNMFEDMKKNVKQPDDEDQVRDYLKKLLHKEAFDKSGLIYGMGHAIYSVSDPRAEVLKKLVESLAEEKGRRKDFALYSMVERLAPEVIADERRIYKGVSANVDFDSGFVYSMLDLPIELYTPMFAVARIVGWSAHRMEELINTDKIIRPAYKNVLEPSVYVPLSERKKEA